jgi:hypothetical protein
MKKYLAAVAFALMLAQPAAAVTFSSLTTIYIGIGVLDNGGGFNAGTAMTFIARTSAASLQACAFWY